MQNNGEDGEQPIDVGLGIQTCIGPEQCGFRKNRSTADHLVRFDTYIRNAFAQKEHVLAICFDLEKAYDTMWKHGILSDLYDLDFRGRLPTFIDGFLSHRLFQVRPGSTLPDTYEQEIGVPQGSILSPVLFSVKINNIVKSVLKGSEASLFVDGFALCVRAKFLPHAQRLMQLCVNSDRIGFLTMVLNSPPAKQSACTSVISVNTLQNRLSC